MFMFCVYKSLFLPMVIEALYTLHISTESAPVFYFLVSRKIEHSKKKGVQAPHPLSHTRHPQTSVACTAHGRCTDATKFHEWLNSRVVQLMKIVNVSVTDCKKSYRSFLGSTAKPVCFFLVDFDTYFSCLICYIAPSSTFSQKLGQSVRRQCAVHPTEALGCRTCDKGCNVHTLFF
uniref:Putative secreted protein n=1 Tax=Ixodes ricinus TaxID=34613 RepID=A0A6B0UZK7_IXORI